MNAQLLLDQASVAPVPAPMWFIEFFKWLGFTLHAVPMNLWYAGLLVALFLHVRGNDQARRFAARLLQQMPIIVAFGVNFGVVPLLFVQVAYYKAFYPATILMAWFWMAIIGLVMLAYYGVYAYAGGIRNAPQGMERWRTVAGWSAALFFIVAGFLFANGLSLMDHVERWTMLFQRTEVAGAVRGTALNVGDATLYGRWLLMFGLALGTTAVWALIDAFFLAYHTTDDAYREWAIGFAKKLYTVSMIWTALAGALYVFAWSPDLRDTMFSRPILPLTLVTAVATGLPWLLVMTADWCSEKRLTVASIALCQFGVLGINALSRQIVQNINLKAVDFDVWKLPVDVQWGPMAMFLIVFVLGVAVIGWMVWQIRKCKPAKNALDL